MSSHQESHRQEHEDSDAVAQSILVVDDEPEVITAFEDLLEEHFEVIGRTSASAGLKALEDDPSIAVVVSDQRMPEMGGDEFLAHVKTMSIATRVLITGFSDIDAVIRAVNDGKIFAYISKPWDPAYTSVTIHRAAEQFKLTSELARERALMHDLMQHHPDAIYFKDLEHRFVRINKPVLDLVGAKTESEVLGKSNSDLLSPFRAKRHNAEERKIFESGEPLQDRLERVIRQDGSTRWYSSTKAIVRDLIGKPSGLVGSTRDVTQRLLAEQERDILLELSTKITDSEDLESAIQAVLSVLGQVIGATYGEAWLPDDNNNGLSLCPRCFAETDQARAFRAASEGYRFDYGEGLPGTILKTPQTMVIQNIETADPTHFVRKDIALKHGFQSCIGIAVRGKSKEPMAVLVLMKSAVMPGRSEYVTTLEAVARQLGIFLEAKRDEDRLRENEQILRAVFETQTELVTRIRPDGTRVFANPAFEKFLGKTNDEILATTPFETVPKDYHDRLNYLYNLSPEAPEKTVMVPMPRHDGVLCWMDWRARGLFDDRGDLIEIQASARDVTEQVTAEQEAKQATNRLSDAVHALPVGFALFDENDTLILHNDLFKTDRPTELQGKIVNGTNFSDIVRCMADAKQYVNLGETTDDQYRARMNLWHQKSGRYEINYRDGKWREVIQVVAPGRNSVVLRVDITDRKSNEWALARSEAMFRDFADAASDWMWEADKKGRVVEVHSDRNPMVNGDLNHIVQNWWRDVTSKRSVASDSQNSDGTETEFTTREIKTRQADGSEKYYSVNARRSHDELTGDVRYRGTITDITAQRQAERQVRESEARLRSILDSADDTIFLHDAHGRLLEVNEAAVRNLGYSRDDLLSMTVHDIEAGHSETNFLKLLQSDQPRTTVTGFYRHKDGGEFPVEVHVARVANADNKQFVAIARDMTAWENLLTEVRHNNERFRVLIAHSSQGVLVHRNFKPLLANPALAKLLGFDSPDEIMKLESLKSLFHPEEMERVTQYSDLRAQGGAAPSSYEVRCKRKDGTTIYVENRAAKIPWHDGPAICANMVDITQQRAIQEQLYQAQKMEAVGQLTGGIAHDFNNLLTVILGNLNLLLGRSAKIDDPKLERWVRNANHAAERGADLTKRLLAFSRRQVLEPLEFDVVKTVEEMAEMFNRVLDANVDLEFGLPAGKLLIRADPSQFESAVLNLVVNARDAMPDGGKILVKVEVDELEDRLDPLWGETVPGRYVTVSVSDTGTGMTEDVRKKVFEPFFTTKESGKGTGLGLSMVFGFLKQSGGNATIYSEVGVGTTVKLYFPEIDLSSGTQADHRHVESINLTGRIIILAEDDPAVRQTAESMLRKLGCTVLSSESGHQALALLKSYPTADLLFTDIVMPGGMNGLELAEEAQALVPDLPILFTSGYAEGAIRETGHSGAGNWLSKPYTLGRLVEKMSAAIQARESQE